MKKVTKFDLVEAVYEITTYDKKVVQTVIDSFLEEIKNSLKDSSTIEYKTFLQRLVKGFSFIKLPPYFYISIKTSNLRKKLLKLRSL